jgi:hypothetical protein
MGFAHSETLPETCPEGIGRVGGYLLFEQAVKAGLEHLSALSRAFEFALDVAVLHNVGLTPLEVLPGAIEVRRDDVATHVAPVVAPIEREPTRPRGIEFDTITHLEERIRTKVDEDGKELSDEVVRAFGTHDFDRVIISRVRIIDWLAGEGQSASRPVRGSLYALLADIAVLEAGLGVDPTHVDYTPARDLYRRALEAYGPELSEEDSARLTTLRAKLDYLADDRNAALALVDGRLDPPCLSLRLSILIERGCYEEAARALRGVPLHEKWCDRAVTTHLMAGDRGEVDRILSWAREREDPACYHLALLVYFQALVLNALGGPAAAERARPHSVDVEQRSKLEEALDALLPFLQPADSGGRARSGLEVEAHTLAVRIALLTGDVDRRSHSAEVLGRITPVPVEFGNAAFRGDVPTPGDLPARLRGDHPRSFD